MDAFERIITTINDFRYVIFIFLGNVVIEIAIICLGRVVRSSFVMSQRTKSEMPYIQIYVPTRI